VPGPTQKQKPTGKNRPARGASGSPHAPPFPGPAPRAQGPISRRWRRPRPTVMACRRGSGPRAILGCGWEFETPLRLEDDLVPFMEHEEKSPRQFGFHARRTGRTVRQRKTETGPEPLSSHGRFPAPLSSWRASVRPGIHGGDGPGPGVGAMLRDSSLSPATAVVGRTFPDTTTPITAARPTTGGTHCVVVHHWGPCLKGRSRRASSSLALL